MVYWRPFTCRRWRHPPATVQPPARLAPGSVERRVVAGPESSISTLASNINTGAANFSTASGSAPDPSAVLIVTNATTFTGGTATGANATLECADNRGRLCKYSGDSDDQHQRLARVEHPGGGRQRRNSDDRLQGYRSSHPRADIAAINCTAASRSLSPQQRRDPGRRAYGARPVRLRGQRHRQ